MSGKLYLSIGQLIKLGIPQTPIIKVRAGNIITNAELVINKEQHNAFTLSQELSKNLYLGNHNRLQIRYDANAGLIHIGPTIGIFAPSLPNQEVYSPRSLQAELIFLSNIGQTLPAQIFVFTPSSIDWKSKTTRGYIYSEINGNQGEWVSYVYPLPDIVYNRLPSRASESESKIKRTARKLRRLPYLKYFNLSFLNKWKVHQLLITNPELHPFLPETKLLNAVNLAEMLKKHSELYLKPCNGSLGKGIIKVTVNQSGKIRFVLYGNIKISGTADNHLELLRKTRRYRRRKLYIVQQGLDLANYKSSPFDIRIIFQKNRKGDWQVGKKFVRVAPPGSSISNLSSGGRAEKSSQVFHELYKKKEMIEAKSNELNYLCLSVATTLEEASRSVYGELGLDIGLDKSGHPWLIEVNSKPRKSTKTNFSRTIVKNSFKRPLEYAIFLAGFKNI